MSDRVHPSMSGPLQPLTMPLRLHCTPRFEPDLQQCFFINIPKRTTHNNDGVTIKASTPGCLIAVPKSIRLLHSPGGREVPEGEECRGSGASELWTSPGGREVPKGGESGGSGASELRTSQMGIGKAFLGLRKKLIEGNSTLE